MSFASPAWLLLLAGLPLLWWLHRRVTAPRDVVVASVDALRGAVADAPAARPERRLDPELAAWLGGVLCLVLAAAGLHLATPAPAVLVVVDGSASMGRRDTKGAPLRDTAIAALRDSLLAADADCVADVLPLGSDGVPARVRAGDLGTLGAAAQSPSRNASADGLPGSLAPALRFARERGYPGLVLVTDRDPGDWPGVVVAGPPRAPADDAGILGVVLDDGVATVRVLLPAVGSIRLQASIPGDGEIVPVPPRADGDGRVVEVRVSAPDRGGQARYAVLHGAGADDGYRANDAVVVERKGGVSSVRLERPGALGAGRLRALLDVLGIAVETSAIAEVDARIVVGGPPAFEDGAGPPLLHLAIAPGEAPGTAVRGDGGVVTGARVAASGLLGDAVPDPAVRLAATGRIDAGDADVLGAWRDADGLLAVALPRRVLVALDPERPGWAGDASFPVLVRAALDHLAGGQDRLEAIAALPLSEALPPGTPPAPATPEAVAAVVRPADADPTVAGGGGPLAAVGAVLLAVAAWLAAARGRRFSGWAAGTRTAG